MQPSDLKAALEEALPISHLDLSFEGNHAMLTIVSEAFDGLSAVKKQQLVYAVLQPAIASGAIHAVHMRTYTPAEWAAQ